MAHKGDYKALSAITKDITYATWKKEISIWQLFTSLEKKKQAPAIFLSLSGQAREAVLELELEKLNDDNGVTNLLEKLDKLYLKDDTHSAYEVYERFETFSRAPSMTVSDYIIEFECLYNKAKQHKIELPDGVLAYRFLNSADISSHHKQLVRATLPELSYQSMKDQLNKIFSDPTNLASDTKQEQATKVEPAQDVYYSSSIIQIQAKFNSHRGCGRGGAYQRGGFGRSDKVVNWRSGQRDANSQSSQRISRRINPLDANGEICHFYTSGSIFHWSYACPDSYESRDPVKEKDSDVQIQLLEETMETLIGETLRMAVLDSGCTKTVSGETWLNCYL